MKRVVEYALEEGGFVLVEVEVPEGGGFERAGVASEIIKATQSFNDALEHVKPAAAIIIKKLRDISIPPDEIEVEFGLKLGAKAGAVIASADAEANYVVKLRWSKPKGK